MKLELTRAHEGTQDLVKRRLAALEHRLRTKYRLNTTWLDAETLAVDGHGVQGRIELDDTELRVALELSTLLAPLRGRIEKELGREIEQILAPAA